MASRRVHNSGAPAGSETPDMRLRSYPEELSFRVRRFMSGQRIYVLILLLSMVMARSTDQVLFYRMLRKYKNYVWYLSTIVLPLAYIAITVPVVLYKVYVSKTIPQEKRQWKYHRIYMIGAACDTLFNLTSSWPVPYLSGPIVNTLSNAVLPFTMIAAMIFLKTKYKFTHFVGATMVMYGIMVQLLPQLFLGENANEGAEEKQPGVWIVILILSAVPAAFSNVVKEGGLKKFDLDEWHANACISGYQFCFGLLTAPTVAIPFPEPAAVISLQHLPHYMKQANDCFFGRNSQELDDCNNMSHVFAFFIIFNITYNQLSLMIYKSSSSALFTVASALRLPVVDFLLLSSFIAGPASVSSISVYTYYALFAIIVGIVTYYREKEVSAVGVPGKDELVYEESSPLMSSPHIGGKATAHHAPAPPRLRKPSDLSAPLLDNPATLDDIEYGAL